MIITEGVLETSGSMAKHLASNITYCLFHDWHKFDRGIENKTDIWLDKARALSHINETDISLLTCLTCQDDWTDKVYWPKRGLNTFNERQNCHQS